MTIIKEERLKWRSDKQGFGGIKEDILGSHKEDKHLKRVDDAKKAAIHQSRDYDEFKDLVSTCHLKPIQKNEFNAPAKLLSSNSLFNGRQSDSVAVLDSHNLKSSCEHATHKQDFYTKLARQPSGTQWAFVKSHSADMLHSWFQSGMEEAVFADLINTLDISDTIAVTLIRSFSKFAWYSRATEFLSAAERAKLS